MEWMIGMGWELRRRLDLGLIQSKKDKNLKRNSLLGKMEGQIKMM
jgi:hypothetical protein